MRQLLTFCLTTLVVLLPLAAQSNELTGLRAAADRAVKNARTDGAGLTVFRGSRELHRSLHDGLTGDQAMPIASASKWLTVATILTLVDDGTLELHAAALHVVVRVRLLEDVLRVLQVAQLLRMRVLVGRVLAQLV